MSYSFPTSISSIYRKLSNDVKNGIKKSNPFRTYSLTKAILAAFAGRIWDVYKQIEAFIDEMFDDTRDTTLLRECADYGLTQNPATVATGYISVFGTAAEIVPINTQYIINSLVYKVDSNTTITQKTPAVTLAYNANVVTATFVSDHGLGTGQEVTFSGAALAALNIAADVSVVSAKIVTYTAVAGGSGSDTGVATYSNALTPITSVGYGEDYNLNSGEVLTISGSLEDIDDDAVVTYDGITGGVDLEDPEDMRVRLQYRKKNPVTFFNTSQVTGIMSTLSWVARVFIKRITPAVGYATIYLVKADNEIPSDAQITAAQTFLDDYLPINCDETLIIVAKPTANEIEFEFSALDPDTTTMRAAIEANLEAMFLERSDVGVTITEAAYLGVIANTVDPQTLSRVTTFTLDAPSGDIDPEDDELSTYDDTTWSI